MKIYIDKERTAKQMGCDIDDMEFIKAISSLEAALAKIHLRYLWKRYRAKLPKKMGIRGAATLIESYGKEEGVYYIDFRDRAIEEIIGGSFEFVNDKFSTLTVDRVIRDCTLKGGK